MIGMMSKRKRRNCDRILARTLRVGCISIDPAAQLRCTVAATAEPCEIDAAVLAFIDCALVVDRWIFLAVSAAATNDLVCGTGHLPCDLCR